VHFSDSCLSLSEYLKKSDFNTIAVLSNPIINYNMDFERGFDFFENVSIESIEKGKRTIGLYGPIERALEILSDYEAKGKSIFMWLEYALPKYPYVLAKDVEAAKGEHPYDRQVLLLDEALKKFFEGLRKLGMDKTATIIFTATNGEGLNEHAEDGAGIFIYNSTVKIPLILKYPEGPLGEKVKKLASHIDIVPTILSIIKKPYNILDFDGIALTKIDEIKKNRSLYLEAS